MTNHERTATSTEAMFDKDKELETIGERQKDQLRESLDEAEVAHERTSSTRESLEALQNAETISHKKEAATERSPAERRRGPSKKQREASFAAQMQDIQADMSPSKRFFSKMIHTKPVEKTSDFLAATIARPNALLASSIFAFVIVTILYLLSKNYGYQLSGFETIGAAALGWILGMIYDYTRLLISGKTK